MRRDAFIYCFQGEERISAFFNTQINDKENTRVIQVCKNSSFNFFFPTERQYWKNVMKNAHHVLFSYRVAFIHLTQWFLSKFSLMTVATD